MKVHDLKKNGCVILEEGDSMQKGTMSGRYHSRKTHLTK